MPIETMEDWNEGLSCCVAMPLCPVPEISYQTIEGSLAPIGTTNPADTTWHIYKTFTHAIDVTLDVSTSENFTGPAAACVDNTREEHITGGHGEMVSSYADHFTGYIGGISAAAWIAANPAPAADSPLYPAWAASLADYLAADHTGACTTFPATETFTCSAAGTHTKVITGYGGFTEDESGHVTCILPITTQDMTVGLSDVSGTETAAHEAWVAAGRIGTEPTENYASCTFLLSGSDVETAKTSGGGTVTTTTAIHAVSNGVAAAMSSLAGLGAVTTATDTYTDGVDFTGWVAAAEGALSSMDITNALCQSGYYAARSWRNLGVSYADADTAHANPIPTLLTLEKARYRWQIPSNIIRETGHAAWVAGGEIGPEPPPDGTVIDCWHGTYFKVTWQILTEPDGWNALKIDPDFTANHAAWVTISNAWNTANPSPPAVDVAAHETWLAAQAAWNASHAAPPFPPTSNADPYNDWVAAKTAWAVANPDPAIAQTATIAAHAAARATFDTANPEPTGNIPDHAKRAANKRTLSDPITWEWTGPGDPANDASWLSGWFDLAPPSVNGTCRVVNVVFECIKPDDSPYGWKPQVTGEGVDPSTDPP